MSEARFYVTTPIYYVNDEAHIGHAYTTTLADVLRTYHRIFGEETFFLTGLDEHGQKVQQAAERAGISPQKHCDLMAPRFQALWEKMGIHYDDFIRTTESRHQAVVKSVLQKIWDQGLIYEATYTGWYELSEERFLTDKEIEEKGYTPNSPEITYIQEKNYFFRMSQFQDWLVEHIQTHPEFILPEGRCNEILGFLRQPLGDLCISRPKSRLSWGIELPFDSNYVTYVWFDALLNYISAPLSRGGEAELQKWWPHSVHLIGKDILTTHCVYWPIMLKAAGYEPPKTILAHGWWLVDATKMSKSKGNVVKPLDLMEKYGVDAFRYFLMRDMSLGADSSFSEKALVERMNSDLANDFGNLLNRTLNLLQRNFEGIIPAPGPQGLLEQELETLARNTIARVRQLVLDYKLHTALEEILQLVRRANKYMEQTAPWKTIKTDVNYTATILWHVLETLRLASALLAPVIPGKIAELLEQLGLHQTDLKLEWGLLPTGIHTRTARVLFPRQEFNTEEKHMENNTERAIASASAETSSSAETSGIALIGIDDFGKIDLRVAQVLEAERVPKTDKLMRLLVDLGQEQRQIIAGIAAYYRPEQLLGKKVIVVANLKPVKLRGLESQGMLLAAKNETQFSILTVLDEVAAGSRVS